MPKLTVVIVAYRSEATIEACVASLPHGAEIIVVENPAAGSVLPPLATAKVVRMDRNEGFGRACNAGLQIAAGEVALILNPDARAYNPADVQRLIDTVERDGCIAVGGRLLLPSGKIQLSCARELTLGRVLLEQTLLEKLVYGYWIDTSAALEPLKVPQVTGACFVMRRVDGEFLRFDPRFFLYCEDTELMKRLGAQGSIVHDPKAVFHHALGASSEGNRWWAIACYNRGKELYFALHHGAIQSAICLILDRLGALLRLLIWTVAMLLTLGLLGRFRRLVATFVRVLFAPIDPYRSAPWSGIPPP